MEVRAAAVAQEARLTSFATQAGAVATLSLVKPLVVGPLEAGQ